MTVWTEGLTAWLQRPNRREMLLACFPTESTPAAKLKSKDVLRIGYLLGCGFVQEDFNEHYAFWQHRESLNLTASTSKHCPY